MQILRGTPLGVVASIELNLNTGIGIRDGKLEFKVLGFGLSSNGIHTPLGSVRFGP